MEENKNIKNEIDDKPAWPPELVLIPGVSDKNGPLVMNAWLPDNKLFMVQRGYTPNTPWVCAFSGQAKILTEIDRSDFSQENWNKAINAALDYFMDQIQGEMQSLQAQLNNLNALRPNADA